MIKNKIFLRKHYLNHDKNKKIHRKKNIYIIWVKFIVKR
jgi:hypothetical protein